MNYGAEELAEGILKGDRGMLARAITMVENEKDGAEELLSALDRFSGNACVIGITGPPGVGKSTFVDCLTLFLRGMDKKVGVIAVDPSSPFSGGAVLGDRIRMRRHTLDDGVFVRSMGSRGSLGGLSLKTSYVSRLMDAFGMDFIIIETVGVGQSEVEIAFCADTVMVILAPGFGDEIQALKAGILEIADIFVVNKSDCEGAEKLYLELIQMTMMNQLGTRDIPIVKCCSKKNENFESIYEELQKHCSYLKENSILEKKRNDKLKREITELIKDNIRRQTSDRIEALGGLDEIISGMSGKNIFETAKYICSM